MRNLLIFLLITTTLVSQDKYIHAGKIFDSSSGEYQLNKTIIISGNTISSIEDGFIEPKNENIAVYDLKSKVLLPGLIDFHVHMESESGGKERYINRFQDNKADVAYKSTVIAFRSEILTPDPPTSLTVVKPANKVFFATTVDLKATSALLS